VFKIIDFRNNSGKIIITIETTDQATADFLRFFDAANKFSDLFHYRMKTAKGIDGYQKTAPHKMALARKEYAEQLERYLQLSGTRLEKFRMLKEIRISNGERVTLDRIEAEISLAIKYEKEDVLSKIKVLLDNGKSLNDISKALELPKTTVARYIKRLRPPEPPSEKPSRNLSPYRRLVPDRGSSSRGTEPYTKLSGTFN
jgi:hypothetical protein